MTDQEIEDKIKKAKFNQGIGYTQAIIDALDVINAHPELDPNHTLRSKILNLKLK